MNDTGMPALRSGHVGLNVTDLDRSIEFYTRVLGLEVLGRTDPEPRYAFLGRDESTLLTLWEQSSGEFTPDQPGLHHVAFQVADADEARHVAALLHELGVPMRHSGLVRHDQNGESGGVFCTDPDGIRVEIYTAAGLADAPAPTGAVPACGFF